MNPEAAQEDSHWSYLIIKENNDGNELKHMKNM